MKPREKSVGWQKISQRQVFVYGNALVRVGVAFYFFLLPVVSVVRMLADPGLRTGDVPRFAFDWHRQLSTDYAVWARERVAEGAAANLSLNNISGTEWPVFSSVFYLWATESLQEAWDEDPTLAPVMPKEYAEGAIDAAAALISDPNHANWVKLHWGEDYLHQENIFYRMLLISGLTSYQKLTDNDQYEPLLRDQVETLAQEIDASPYGLLDDYPGQCYPIDILPAIAAIQRADPVLGTDHSAFVVRALRGFTDTRLDPHTDLPAYIANANTGLGYGPARGVGISYMLIWAPELWPETAQQWYSRYEQLFWQESWLITGVREFAREQPYPAWFLDVDAGPVVAGYGTAATAFGLGATRVNGRMDQAYPLSAEALLVVWPLPNGTLLGPRLLSNLSDAPYVGEAALLFSLTRRPQTANITPATSSLPGIVYLGLALYTGIGLLLLSSAIRFVHRKRYISKTE